MSRAASSHLYSTGIRSPRRGASAGDCEPGLADGQIGKEGAGIFALTEHNNLQGVCDMGMLPDRLPGYHKVASDAARAELEALWGTRLPAKPGLASRSLLANRGHGQVRAVWLCRYDPVSTAFFGDAANALS
jgi:predicted molibdopterin-dependent oxidoreductase YjgC